MEHCYAECSRLPHPRVNPPFSFFIKYFLLQHASYVKDLGGPGNLGDDNWAIWEDAYDCGTGTAAPAPAPTPAPTAAKTGGTFDAAALCADKAAYSIPTPSKVDGVTFCAKYIESTSAYEFVMLVKPGLAWGAVGFNSKGAMKGTEVMWLGVENGLPSLQYKMASSYATPANTADQPQSVTAENVAAGIQAKWTRKLVEGGLTVLTDDTAALNILFVSKAGTPGGAFAKHDKTEIISSVNLAVAGASSGEAVQEIKGTAGNLAHGALMILAWACFSPIGVMFMKYGKHLPLSYWFKTHKYLMPCAILATIAAFVSILASGVKYDELAANPKSKTHALCGFAVLALCIVQGLLGAFRGKISGHEEADDKTDYNHGANRYIFNALHRSIGWSLYGLALATIYKGITLFDEKITAENPKVWLQDPAGTLFQVYCYIALGVVAVLELLHITKYQWSSGGPFSCSGSKAYTATFKADGAFEQKVRSVALALFSAFSIAVTITLWVIIADTTTK